MEDVYVYIGVEDVHAVYCLFCTVRVVVLFEYVYVIMISV